MKKSELKTLVKQIIKEISDDGNLLVVAIIDNNVFPHSSDELSAQGKKFGLRSRLVGDAANGTETMRSYRMLFSGERGELDSFVHGVSEEKGVEFHVVENGKLIREYVTLKPKLSKLKSIINEVITEIMDDEKNPLYVEYVSERSGEEEFMMGGQKFQFVNAKYPNGKTDIAVYAFSGDVVYGYEAFRSMHNLK